MRLTLITLFAFAFLALIGKASAESCPRFTDEQQLILTKAALIGAPHDWSYTLAAITWQEGFWGAEVRRENPNDAPGGSWGVTQIRVTTAMWIVGWEDTEMARQVMRDLLVECDTCALELALTYFMGHYQVRGWRDAIARYNGSGERAERYADIVIARVRVLQRCGLYQ